MVDLAALQRCRGQEQLLVVVLTATGTTPGPAGQSSGATAALKSCTCRGKALTWSLQQQPAVFQVFAVGDANIERIHLMQGVTAAQEAAPTQQAARCVVSGGCDF